MRAVVVERFGAPAVVTDVPDPQCPPDGVVLDVQATGLCRSDWHAWRGHDPGVRLPHVPGHELSGVITEAGRGVRLHRVGERVAVPFVCACGQCPTCLSGDEQVCENQEQPGFTHWGSFAERVALHRADVNLVAVPVGVSPEAAAVVGCRFSTAYRAVVHQGRIGPGQWLVVHGCGGLGLSAVMIGASRGARVVAVDLNAAALEVAAAVGAESCVSADADPGDVADAIREVTEGGAHVSLDTAGHPQAIRASVAALRRRGRHVQVGLLAPDDSTSPPLAELLPDVIARELEVVGSHGMPARGIRSLLAEIAVGRLQPERLVTRRVDLDELPAAIAAMDSGSPVGMTVCLPH
jgi:alcohol dehydrogenase